ncbi:AraC family transcriptional regulator [Pedobacter sp. FW305-3-2-15-E-R2A2]|uniref:helix-turn-helix domain-containing protein n=1 Tax=Pedobacter sp. FW305-3-2-15-E-R2A2 TaxID=3140251 RepID=UPI003140029F
MLKSLILTGAIQGFFLILLLKTKRKNSISDQLLMIWLGIISVQLLFYYDNLSKTPLAPEFLQLLGFSLPLIGSPLLFLYTYALAFGNQFKWKRIWLHLIPYFLFNLLLYYFCLQNPDSILISNGFPHFNKEIPGPMIWFLTSLMAAIPGFYTIYSLLILLKYQRLLPDNYAYTEKITLNWLKWIIISLLILFITLFLLIKYGVNYELLTYDNLFAVVGAILSFYIFFIGYFGLCQTTVFRDHPLTTDFVTEVVPKTSYKNSGMDEEMCEQLFHQLKHHMEENKPFLAEDLSLSILAVQLGLTANQLSQVINQKSAVNFFTFINRYRVAVVKERLNDPAYSHYSILAIGYDCGFRSKSSFNKIFKEIVGQTPSEYRSIPTHKDA